MKHATDSKTWARNIRRHYQSATPETIQAGIAWYPNARASLEPFCNVWTPDVACAVCAVLSPRVTWKECIRYTGFMHKAVSQGLRVPPTCGGVRRNVERAWYIAESGDTSVISGPKVSNFYRNLSGDFHAVTCDSWAARAAGIPDSLHNHIDRSRYQRLADTYRNVAALVGLTPAALQAIVWIAIRENHE